MSEEAGVYKVGNEERQPVKVEFSLEKAKADKLNALAHTRGVTVEKLLREAVSSVVS